MASRRLLLSSLNRYQHPLRLATRGRETIPQPHTASFVATRFFSSGNDDDKKAGGGDSHDDDPFGVNFEDGKDHGRLGPTMPPKYKRDAVTGKFTGEQERELTEGEKSLLKMDTIQEQEYLANMFVDSWDKSEGAGEVDTREIDLGRRIREDNIGTSVLGRSTVTQARKSVLDGGDPGFKDESGVSKPLSPEEFKVFQKHMQDEYQVDLDDDDIPVEPAGNAKSSLDEYADNDYLSSKWLSSGAMRFMDDDSAEDPFADLMPSDLSPSRLVNRRNAKPIPRELLHHNNLALLRRYITPTGQIMNRVHSRLGAKDQRKVAKLIRRARSLGLLPHEGQFAVEAHGNINEKDINEEREWEKELVRRGLVVKKDNKV